MAEVTIGDFEVRFDGANLTIVHTDDAEPIMVLDNDGLEELAVFLDTVRSLSSNRREAYRVSLQGSDLLSVIIRKNDAHLSVIPKTISVTGIFVTPAPGQEISLQKNETVEVLLDFEGESQSYKALVRRCQENGVGLFVTESMTGEQIDPPIKLSRTVMELQRRLMARRL